MTDCYWSYFNWLGGSLGLLIYCSDRAWTIFIKPAAHDCWNVCMGRIVRPKREIIFSDFNQGEVFVIPYAVTFDAMNIAQYHYSMLFNSLTHIIHLTLFRKYFQSQVLTIFFSIHLHINPISVFCWLCLSHLSYNSHFLFMHWFSFSIIHWQNI